MIQGAAYIYRLLFLPRPFKQSHLTAILNSNIKRSTRGSWIHRITAALWIRQYRKEGQRRYPLDFTNGMESDPPYTGAAAPQWRVRRLLSCLG